MPRSAQRARGTLAVPRIPAALRTHYPARVPRCRARRISPRCAALHARAWRADIWTCSRSRPVDLYVVRRGLPVRTAGGSAPAGLRVVYTQLFCRSSPDVIRRIYLAASRPLRVPFIYFWFGPVGTGTIFRDTARALDLCGTNTPGTLLCSGDLVGHERQHTFTQRQAPPVTRAAFSCTDSHSGADYHPPPFCIPTHDPPPPFACRTVCTGAASVRITLGRSVRYHYSFRAYGSFGRCSWDSGSPCWPAWRPANTADKTAPAAENRTRFGVAVHGPQLHDDNTAGRQPPRYLPRRKTRSRCCVLVDGRWRAMACNIAFSSRL